MGVEDVVSKIFTQCNLISGISVLLVVWFAVQYTKLQAEATKRIDAANATIIRLMEAGSKTDEGVAIALSKLEVILGTMQPRRGGDGG